MIIANLGMDLEKYPYNRSLQNTGLIVVLTILSAIVVFGQDAAKPEAAKRPVVKTEESKPQGEKTPEQAFRLSVSQRPILNLSLKAEKAKLVDIAADLSKRLKTQVFVGASLQKEVVSIEFSELTLEQAMQLMAPAVYIDYEIDTGSGNPPKALGIFFYDANSGEPPITAVISNSTQSLLIEGDTEDGVEPETEEAKKKLEEQPLRIQFRDNILSVKAKKQPLALVLLKIGEELGIPVDIQGDAKDIVDTEITKQSVEDVVRKLSPNIRLFLRADLLHAERRALRLVLTDPAKTGQQGL
ncbi:MAG TPA: hypothetical protein VGQ39_23750 [Pyrinomonadaceae bacterium]|jgi:hypothetical protein|nr:hypothetical protein [Pyrinomonadaceae bacterium]